MSSYAIAILNRAIKYVYQKKEGTDLVPIGDYQDSYGKSVNLYTKPENALLRGINRDQYVVNVNNITGNTLTVSSQQITYILTVDQAKLIRALRLGFVVNESGGSQSVTQVLPFMGLQRLEIVANGGSGQILNTLYAETMWADIGLFMENEESFNQLNNMGMSSNFSVATSGSGSVVIPASGYQNWQLPLYSFINNMKPVFNLLKENIAFRFYFRNSVSSGSGTLNLNQLNLIFDHSDLSDSDASFERAKYAAGALKYTFLDHVYTTYTGTITRSVQNKISLQNIKCNVAFMFFMIRSSVSATSQGYTSLTPLAGSGTGQQLATPFNVQLQNTSGQDILNHGQGLGPLDFAYIASQYTPNTFFTNQNIYLIPFVESLRGALLGNREGGSGWYFDGSNYQLVLQPDANFSTATYTVDIFFYYFADLFVDKGRLSVQQYS